MRKGLPNARLKIVLTVAPQVVAQMDPATFTVRLSDAQGRPVDGAAVTTDLVMPAMDMGRNEVVTHRQAPGVYAGTGRFSMDGEWEVIVTAVHGAEKAIRVVPVRVH